MGSDEHLVGGAGSPRVGHVSRTDERSLGWIRSRLDSALRRSCGARMLWSWLPGWWAQTINQPGSRHKAYLGDVCSLSTPSLQNPALPTIPCSALSSKLMTWECRRVHSVAQSHLLCFLHPLTPSASKTLSSHSPPPAHHQLFFLHFPICQFLPISLRKNERMQE